MATDGISGFGETSGTGQSFGLGGIYSNGPLGAYLAFYQPRSGQPILVRQDSVTINSSADDAAAPATFGFNLPLAALASGDIITGKKVKTAIAEATTTNEVWDPARDVNYIAAVLPQTSSWLGDGPNGPVSADDITKTFGEEYLDDLAFFLGLDTDTLTHDLSATLPSYIHSISPAGEVVGTLAAAPLEEAQQGD